MRRLVDLDDSGDPSRSDPSVVGDKAARLARARQLGLPVLPGRVVPAREARQALRRGVAALGQGGSGAARLAVMDEVLDPGLAEHLREALVELGTPVVVRSSSPLEAGGEWAGAFSSFHDVGPADIAVAVRGCWASALSVDVLGRAGAMGVPVESIRLAVLIQPQIHPTAGGTAAFGPDGMVTVETVRGSPAALVAGWQRGVRAEVAALLAQAYTGPVAEELILPWALGTPGIERPGAGQEGWSDPGSATAGAAVRAAVRDLTAWAWGARPLTKRAGRPERPSRSFQRPTLPRPSAAWAPCGRCGTPEPSAAFAATLAATASTRLDPWGPFVRRVLRVHGRSVRGTAAAPGIGAGHAVMVQNPHAPGARPDGRGYVVVAANPLPALAPLLWGASALVTATGGPGAQLVDVARSLRVPAVVSAPVEDLIGPLASSEGRSHVMVVDGGTGLVSAVAV
jgi:hypothetical protein